MRNTISAMHYCIPSKRLTNQELAVRFGENQLKSIVKMAGIKERRVVNKGQTASDLAFWACTHLLKDRNIDPKEIDLLIFASQTHDYQIPATACVMHNRLGLAESCAAFDINLGCTSFPYSLCVADGMLHSGYARKALVINAETITSVIHPQDRGLVPLHGDAGVVSLVEPTEGSGGFIGFVLGTDGTGYNHIIIPASGARRPRDAESKIEIQDESGIVRTLEHLYMNGPAIFHFSVYKIPEVIKEALDKFRLSIDDFDLVLLHQANKTMVDLIYRALNVPPEKRFYYIEMVGNASGASSAMLLAEAWRQGRIKPGSKTLLAAFGVGLSWGVMGIEWPQNVGAAVAAPIEPDETSDALCD